MKQYEEPIMEILSIEDVDIVTASCPTDYGMCLLMDDDLDS